MEEATRWRAGCEVENDQVPGAECAGSDNRAEDRGTTQPRADERIVTLGWFTRNRFFPLREGSTWKEGTASNRKPAIERDILAKFGDLPMEQIDKFALQTHLNDLARMISAGRVMHARFYMKAIFEEAIDQGFVDKNPARKLILPKELRSVDKTTLTWDQLRLVLAPAPRPGHTKADTTVNVYMQPIEEGVKQTLDAIYAELTGRPKLVAVS